MNIWDEIAKQSIDDIKEAILAGYRNGKPFVPDEPQLDWHLLPPIRVCDFGCGLGRNWPMLLNRASLVLAYDRAAMIARIPTQIPAGVKVVNSPDQLRGYAVDVVYCSLVLQHIDVRDALHHMPHHRYLHVYGRGWHDKDGPTFRQIPMDTYSVVEIARYPRDLWPTIREDQSDAHYEVLFERIPL